MAVGGHPEGQAQVGRGEFSNVSLESVWGWFGVGLGLVWVGLGLVWGWFGVGSVSVRGRFGVGLGRFGIGSGSPVVLRLAFAFESAIW